MAFLDILSPITKIIDKVIPDPAQRDKAKLDVLAMQQAGELKELEIQMSAILAEANSKDPWTSRARPGFLWMCYILILWGIPMGVIAAISPKTSVDIAEGFKAWLAAIPDPMYDLLTIVMMGYIGGRSWEKVKGVAK